jgi:ABC-type multidrug transport system fused ATPase/permease subunit
MNFKEPLLQGFTFKNKPVIRESEDGINLTVNKSEKIAQKEYELFEDIGLAFRNFSLSSSKSSKPLLKSISGYVAKGSVTAGKLLYAHMHCSSVQINFFYVNFYLVIGASASGKSILLQALSGRIQDFVIDGEIFIDGKLVEPKSVHNPIAYVPQDDSLAGELTAREVTLTTALLKRDEVTSKLNEDVNTVLEKLGLSHVADGIIGTPFFVNNICFML